MQVYMKRARIRVEILGQESDPQIKYELFQRLNTGGANLSRQEIRNCIVISINKSAQDAIVDMAGDDNFTVTTEPSGEERAQRSFLYELVVRFVALRHHPYKARLDVHDFLDEGIINIAGRKKFRWAQEKKVFKDTFSIVRAAKGRGAFMKSGRFSLGYYEFITLGVSSALDSDKALDPKWLAERIDAMGALPEAERYTGSGVRGTQRLAGFVLAKAKSHFAP
jgi:hypothetical protein